MKLKRICIVILIVLAIFSIQVHAATDLGSLLTKTEYSDEYKAWLELSDEEKKEVMQPKKYKQTIKKNDIQNVKRMNNLVRTMGFLKASTDSKYNLKDVIPENVVVRNQMNTPCCWTFASLGALESNLAMRDKVNSVATPKTYDFSERHMQYATIEKGFLNDKVNDFGYIRELNEGGNFYMATSYLVNGSGAIPESEMMFQNNIDKIDIAEIKNKTISTTL